MIDIYKIKKKMIPSSTYIREMDLQIYSQVKPKILFYLCQTDKYIYSLSQSIWRLKIEALYPNLPIPVIDGSSMPDNLAELYFKISKSYVQLKNIDYFTDWLNIPINKINYIIEESVTQSSKFPTLGLVARYRMQQKKELKVLLIHGIYPKQKSVNLAMRLGNTNQIDILTDYGIFPDQQSINIAAEKGYYSDQLFKYDIFPDQKSINIAIENGHTFIIYGLIKYGKYPNQYIIDIATKKGLLDLDILTQYNIYPNL